MMPDMVLDASTFAPMAPDTAPFGVCSDNAQAIKALRDLADGMEKGTVVIRQAQTGATAATNEFVTFRVFLEYVMKPW